MDYDQQIIVQLDSESLIEDNAKALNNYGNSKGTPSRIVKMYGSTSSSGTHFRREDLQGLNDAFQSLTKNSRVYLQDHGDWHSQKLGIHDAPTISNMLADAGMPAVKMVSVLGCEAARDLGTANDARVSQSVNSFASILHEHLGNKRGLFVNLHARVFVLTMGNPADDENKPETHGHKYTFNDDNQFTSHTEGSHRKNSKMLFYWEAGKQKRRWADKP